MPRTLAPAAGGHGERAVADAPAIPVEEYGARRSRAVELARDRGLDGLLVWSLGGSTLDSFGDVFYLTNHYSPEPKSLDRPGRRGFGHAAVVLPVDGDPALLVNFQSRPDLVVIDDVRSSGDLYALARESLIEKGLTKGALGVVREQFLPLALYRELRAALPNLELVDAHDILDGLRMRKSEAEVAMMRRAQAVGAEIMSTMLSEAVVGRTDADLAAAGFGVGAKRGATHYDFAMASGPHADHIFWSRLPTFDHARPYELGDLVHPDVYGCVDGYLYDIHRTTIVGRKPNDSERGLLDAVVGVNHFLCSELRAGRTTADVHAAALRWMAEHGLDSANSGLHVLPLAIFGHGIGVGFERPYISAQDDTVLEPGMTITAELFVAGDSGLAAHEEVVLVTDKDPEILTAACEARWWT
jgi:Xaa-Pro aminopeptidase